MGLGVAAASFAVLLIVALFRVSKTVAILAGPAFVAVWMLSTHVPRAALRRETRRAADEGRPIWQTDRRWGPQGEVLAPWQRTLPGTRWLLFLAGNVAAIDFARRGFGPVSAVALAIPVTYVAVALFRAHQQGGLQVRWPSFPIRPGGRVVFHIATTPGGSRMTDTIVALRCHGPLGTFDAWDHYPMTVTYLPADRTPGPDEFVEVAFDIPADAPSNDLHAKRPTRWELVVAGDTPWGEIVEVLPVPVYRDGGPVPDARLPQQKGG